MTSETKYAYRFAENGGYDAMTDAIEVFGPDLEYGSLKGFRPISLDLGDFGQTSSWEKDGSTTFAREVAETIAKYLVDGLNSGQLRLPPEG